MKATKNVITLKQILLSQLKNFETSDKAYIIINKI